MINANQARSRLEKLAPKKYLTVKREYITFSNGRHKEICQIWVGTLKGILVEGSTFEDCLKKVKTELGNA